MIDIAELAGKIESATEPCPKLDALVDCVVFGRILWGSNPEMTIPVGEPDHWGMTEAQLAEAVAAHAAADIHEKPSDHDLYFRFGTRLTAQEATVMNPDSAKYVRRIKNPHRRYPANYTSSMNAALSLLRPDQDWERYTAYSGQRVMKIVGPCSDGYPCLGRGCNAPAGLVVARLRQLAAERISRPA